MPAASISLDEAVELARTGDVWLFRGHKVADRSGGDRVNQRGGVWDFLVFGLVMAAGGILGLRDRAAIVGQVLMAIGTRASTWRTSPVHPVAEVRDWSCSAPGRTATMRTQGSGFRRWPSCPAARTSSPVRVRGLWSGPDQCGAAADPHDEKVRLGELPDAERTYAPGLAEGDRAIAQPQERQDQGPLTARHGAHTFRGLLTRTAAVHRRAHPARSGLPRPYAVSETAHNPT